MKTKVVNLRKESYDIYIGRGSIFGNKWTHLPLKNTKAEFQCGGRDESINLFKQEFDKRIKEDDEFKKEVLKLRGKVIGCYCKPLACHGDVIAEYLNNLDA